MMMIIGKGIILKVILNINKNDKRWSHFESYANHFVITVIVIIVVCIIY